MWKWLKHLLFSCPIGYRHSWEVFQCVGKSVCRNCGMIYDPYKRKKYYANWGEYVSSKDD